MKNNIKKYLLAAAGAGLMLTACDIERLPNGSMAAESITSDPDANLESLVRGAYAQLKLGLTQCIVWENMQATI